MLRLPPFEYLSPSSLDEAVQMFASHAPDAMYVAGGTDVYPNMKRRQMEPKFLVGLNGVRDLRGIEYGQSHPAPTIRAGTTLTQLSNHPIMQSLYPALSTAAGLVSTPQLRAMGTIGGNLLLDTRCNYYNQNYWWRKAINFCMKKPGDPSTGSGQGICWVAPGSPRCWAVSSADCAPVMIALGARLKLVGPRGERVIEANDLYRDDGMEYVTKAPDEILTEIILPPADRRYAKSVYLKLRRRGAFDFPILGVAAALRFAPNGEVEDARIVLGGVGSRPLVAIDSAKILKGNKLDEDVIHAAAEAAWKPARPLDNTDMSHSYRKKMSRVYVKRALEICRND